jgi:hypothetical protein
MHRLGIDYRHHEGRNPRARGDVLDDLVAARLGRSDKSRRQGEGIGKSLADRRLSRGGFGEQACRRATGKIAFIFRTRSERASAPGAKIH